MNASEGSGPETERWEGVSVTDLNAREGSLRTSEFTRGQVVHLWVFETPGGPRPPAWTRGLPPEALAEHREAPSSARRENALAWLGAQLLLSHYSSLPLAQLRLAARGTGRKPHLDPAVHLGNSLKFNLSHSGSWTLLALARGREVGVDLERERVFREPLRFAQRFLHQDEYAYLAALDEEARGEGLRRLWVRKEAAAKATGYGLPLGLATFSVLPALPAEAWLELTLKKARAEQPCRWNLRSLPDLPDPALAGALCVEQSTTSGAATLQLFHWAPK